VTETPPSPEEAWRAPLNEALGGVTQEFRSKMEQLERTLKSLQNQRASFQERPPQWRPQHPQQPQTHDEYEDLKAWMEKGGTFDSWKYLHDKMTAPQRDIATLRDELAAFKRERQVEANGKAIVQYLETATNQHVQAAEKTHGFTLTPELRELLERGIAAEGFMSGTDPRQIDVQKLVNKFFGTLSATIKAQQEARVKAAEINRAKPGTVGGGTPAKAGESKTKIKTLDDSIGQLRDIAGRFAKEEEA